MNSFYGMSPDKFDEEISNLGKGLPKDDIGQNIVSGAKLFGAAYRIIDTVGSMCLFFEQEKKRRKKLKKRKKKYGY